MLTENTPALRSPLTDNTLEGILKRLNDVIAIEPNVPDELFNEVLNHHKEYSVYRQKLLKEYKVGNTCERLWTMERVDPTYGIRRLRTLTNRDYKGVIDYATLGAILNAESDGRVYCRYDSIAHVKAADATQGIINQRLLETYQLNPNSPTERSFMSTGFTVVEYYGGDEIHIYGNMMPDRIGVMTGIPTPILLTHMAQKHHWYPRMKMTIIPNKPLVFNNPVDDIINEDMPCVIVPNRIKVMLSRYVPGANEPNVSLEERLTTPVSLERPQWDVVYVDSVEALRTIFGVELTDNELSTRPTAVEVDGETYHTAALVSRATHLDVHSVRDIRAKMTDDFSKFIPLYDSTQIQPNPQIELRKLSR